MNPLDYLTKEILADSYRQSYPQRMEEIMERKDELIGLIHPIHDGSIWRNGLVCTAVVKSSPYSDFIYINNYDGEYCINGTAVAFLLEPKGVLKRQLHKITRTVGISDAMFSMYDEQIRLLKYHFTANPRARTGYWPDLSFENTRTKKEKVRALYVPKDTALLIPPMM